MVENIKGRARLSVSDDLVSLLDVGIKKPLAGEICWGHMEVKELFDTFQSCLLLPEAYTILGVFFDIVLYTWVIVVESDTIPLPEEGREIPILTMAYQRTDDGKVSLVDLRLMQ